MRHVRPPRSAIAPAVAVALGALTLAAGPRAAAAEEPFHIGPLPVWFVLAGPGGGGTVGPDTRGGLVGGELSLVRVRGPRFVGLYADAYYDFGVDGTYLTAGPELGWIRRSRTFPFGVGVDGGLAVRRAGDTQLGVAGRVFVDLVGAVSLYGRYLYLDADTDDHVVQVGVTIKFPLFAPFGSGAL